MFYLFDDFDCFVVLQLVVGEEFQQLLVVEWIGVGNWYFVLLCFVDKGVFQLIEVDIVVENVCIFVCIRWWGIGEVDVQGLEVLVCQFVFDVYEVGEGFFDQKGINVWIVKVVGSGIGYVFCYIFFVEFQYVVGVFLKGQIDVYCVIDCCCCQYGVVDKVD